MAQGQNPEEDIWRGLDEIDLSSLDGSSGVEQQYPIIPGDEISRATDPLKAGVLRRINEEAIDARLRALGERGRERTYHQMGWHLSITTPNGLVGLWSSEQGNGFYLGYPRRVDVPDELVMETLEVEHARPVADVNFGTSKWAEYYGPQLGSGIPQGRVWVNHKLGYGSGVHFPVITDGEEWGEVHYGGNFNMGIWTEPYSLFSEHQPEAPNALSEAIQPYREKFISLSSKIAFIMGGPQRVNVSFGHSLIPEDLYREGYTEITWLKGDLGERKGWGQDVVRGKKGDSTVILKSGNGLYPWLTLLSIPAGKVSSPSVLSDFIIEDVLRF